MANNQARADDLRAQAEKIENEIASREAKKASGDDCGCQVARGVARGVATAAVGALLGVPISF